MTVPSFRFTPGDPTVIREMTEALVKAYENYVNSFPGRVTYTEGFMAMHNAHVAIIEDLVQETGAGIWRIAARDTFSQRMDNPGAYDTKEGPQ